MSTGQSPLSDVSESETTSGESIRASGPDRPADTSPVTIGTCLLFLLGHRGAIERIANAPAATWLAFSWVLLAALFRDYDHADLLREPGWLVVPLLASTLLAALLFILLKYFEEVRISPLPQGIQFRRLLTCFWMTAPMAMIYAIPVERFYSEPDATRWNLTFLAVVATWRVLLITRVVSVLYRFPFFRAIWLVMLLADTLALIAMFLIPIPLLQIMGGVELSESSQIINDARINVIFLGITTWLFWLIGVLYCAAAPSKTTSPQSTERPHVPLKRGPWIALGVGCVVMLIACVFTQSEQQRAAKFRQLVLSGQADQGIQFLSQFTPEQLPPHWDAPPRIDHRESRMPLFPILGAIAATPQTPSWIRDLYAAKLIKVKGKWRRGEDFWFNLTPEDLKHLVLYLKAHPEVLKEFEKATGYDLKGSIRCTVVRLLENDLRLPGSPGPFPLELVRELLELDQEDLNRSCGSKADVDQMLEELSWPVAPSATSEIPEEQE